MGWFIGGKVDHIPATIFAGYPRLMRVHDAVRDHARMAGKAAARTERVLTQRELNRALLARQLLLERSGLSIDRAVELVGGLQTQYAPSGYIGLWSRVRLMMYSGVPSGRARLICTYTLSLNAFSASPITAQISSRRLVHPAPRLPN